MSKKVVIVPVCQWSVVDMVGGGFHPIHYFHTRDAARGFLKNHGFRDWLVVRKVSKIVYYYE